MARIAVVTVSGSAYYKLVNELKNRSIPFLSLKPGDPVPLQIKVVITTKSESRQVSHPNVLIFEEEADPKKIINEAINVVNEKKKYEVIIVGVDPGKTFGVAVIGDGTTLKTVSCSSVKETVNTILEALYQVSARVNMVKIGNGAPDYTKELLRSLNESLPKEIVIQLVCEAGTSQSIKGIAHRRRMRDVVSAIRIAERKGRVYPRRRPDGAHFRKGQDLTC